MKEEGSRFASDTFFSIDSLNSEGLFLSKE